MVVRRFLHGKGSRFRLHVRELPGRPNLALPKYDLVVFVEGCFGCGHSCQKRRMPHINPAFWQFKADVNKDCDERIHCSLRRWGSRVICIWGCQSTRNGTRNVVFARLVPRIMACAIRG
ncbi:TPA: very short patch repair endonuclease [Stenotrophomonas maltophilia]|uniref:very short patch repair endonuclease n=1 Tax=Stenotrophomonas maltophilia TaxID=40324 RepID=UPI000C1482FB